MVGLAIVTGAILSWFASQYPDGLEWSMEKVAGTAELETPGNSIYEKFKSLQEKTAFLPDYDFKAPQEQTAKEEEAKWPAVSAGTSISGLIGGTITLLLVILFGFLLKNKKVVE
jgi:cobalt/nickel transport system permease protein